jgi:hypothetical protein
MNEAGCVLQPLSSSSCCQVHACLGCGAIHLTIGPMTWRFEVNRFLDVGQVLAEAITRYHALRLDDQLLAGGAGPGSTRRPQ